MAPPPTRKEQLALDELLNDIYRGIETLPDSASRANAIESAIEQHATNNGYKITHRNQQVKHYELPSSSPIVQQHKQDLRNNNNTQYPFAQQQQQSFDNPTSSPASINQQQQPGRSTLKRQQEAQSLASFLKADLSSNGSRQPSNLDTTSQGGTSKRRVRIVEHPEKLAKQQQQQDNQENQYRDSRYPAAGSPYARSDDSGVKYVNSNQLIYHEEPQSKWNEHDSVYTPVVDQDVLDYQRARDNSDQESLDGADDFDGKTRVEYYHTSWLDRQLGRASKRRSSKELNERQVKEKAMIEELKRSLKNGAITLKRSLKGGNKHKQQHQTNNIDNNNTYTHNSQYLLSADDQLNSYTDRPAHKAHQQQQSSIFATIPRKYNNNKQQQYTKPQPYISNYTEQQQQTVVEQQQQPDYHNNPISAASKDQQQHSSTGSPAPGDYSSRTLPNQASHQLIKSHYRRGHNFNTLSSPSQVKQQSNPYSQQAAPSTSNNNNMRYPQSATLMSQKAPINYNQEQQPQQYNTISRIPSATEVVRSALESNRSHLEDQRLRKTINSLETPSPYPSSPQTPTHQLKAASPSLSPSPAGSPGLCSPVNYSNQNHNHQNMNSNNQQVLRGTRIIPASSPANTMDNNNSRQPVYANPHASFMQQRAEQQARGIYAPTSTTTSRGPNANQASLREFNELDSLLKSLSPNASSMPASRPINNTLTPAPIHNSQPANCGPKTQISAGYSSRPAQATLGGYGGVFPANNQQQQQPDVYAKIQRQQQNKPLQPSHLNNSNFTLDVTDDRSTLERQPQQQQQSFKAPNQYEILPSMEDYQNISKLNPVRNHYWYKPNMTRDRAIALLKDKPQGTFIVRDSNSFRGAYGLAVKVAKLPPNVLNNSSLRDPSANPSDELIRHFLIEPTANGVRLKGYANEPVFGSLPNLIYQHSLTELALPCRLIIPRADIEDTQFNLKQKQFVEDFLASKEEAKHLPYERTSPDGGYRRYPGNVLVHNEHRIIFQ